MEENISCWCSHTNICPSSKCCVMCYWFTEMIQNDRTKLFIPQRPCCSKHRTSINQCFVHWGHKALQIPFVLKRTLGDAPICCSTPENNWVLSSLCFVSCTDNLVRYTFQNDWLRRRHRCSRLIHTNKDKSWDLYADVSAALAPAHCGSGSDIDWKNFISITEGERFPRSAGRILHSLRLLFHLAANKIHFPWTTPGESFPVLSQYKIQISATHPKHQRSFPWSPPPRRHFIQLATQQACNTAKRPLWSSEVMSSWGRPRGRCCSRTPMGLSCSGLPWMHFIILVIWPLLSTRTIRLWITNYDSSFRDHK